MLWRHHSIKIACISLFNQTKKSRYGEIGRHKGFRIPRIIRLGSNPSSGTIILNAFAEPISKNIRQKQCNRSRIKIYLNAGVAQLVEQLICNQRVGGSSPSTSSNKL